METAHLSEGIDAAAKNFQKTLIALLILLVSATSCLASTITLQWDPETAEDLAGYKVYYADSAEVPFAGTGAAQGASPVDVAQINSATITGLDPNRSYYFAVTAYNTAGVESPYSNIVHVPELVPPTVAITSPATDSQVTGTVSINASASDNVAVASVRFYVNGVLAVTNTEAPYLFSWENSALQAGSYSIMAEAVDAAGNVGKSSVVTLSLVKDAEAPVVSMLTPGNGATVSGTVAVKASATDNQAVSKIEIYENGALVFAGNDNPVSYNWNTTAVPNGSCILSVRAFDAAGNASQTASVTVKVSNDATAPTVSITSPVGGSTASGAVLVSAWASDEVAVSRVEFYVNDLLQATASNAPFGFSWDTAAVANGAFTLSAKAYDAAGNVGHSANVVVNVFNDTTAPSVLIGLPVANSTVAGSVSVLADASDNVAVTKVEFYVNGALKATSTGAPYSFTWNTAALANGAYSLSVKAYDAAGNVAQSGISVNVFYDRTAPTVTAFSMPGNINSTMVAVLSLVASDNVAVSGYLITESAIAPSASAAGWSATAPASFTFAGTGARTAYAWVKDAAGNVSAGKAVPVFIDTVLPMIKSMTLASGSSSVTVKVSATDNVAVTKMELYLDNSLLLTTSDSTFSYDISFSVKRSQSVTVMVYDAAGNVRTRSLRVSKS